MLHTDVSLISHLSVNGNPLPILINTVYDQFMRISYHSFQHGAASANCRLQVMPSPEKSDLQNEFLKKKISKI